MHDFDYCVFILRAHPFHNGHLTMLRRGLEEAERLILVIGSHRRSRSIMNPFTSEEREAMIRASLTDEENARVMAVYVRDTLYNYDAWLSDVQEKVRQATGYASKKICLIGYQKDATSSYLESFPTWPKRGGFLAMPINATDIRNAFFLGSPRKASGVAAPARAKAQLEAHLTRSVPSGTAEFLRSFASSSPEFERLQEEWFFVDGYMAPYRKLPHPPNFVTGDAMVVQSGHVLVVVRGGKLGRGLFALPGGFVNQDETIDECIFRELKEETSIKIPVKPLVKSWVATDKFDHPMRSVRRRSITHTGYFRLEDMEELPQVKGGGDARRAFWMPLSETHENEHLFFEDHYHMIWTMIRRYAVADDKRNLLSAVMRGR